MRVHVRVCMCVHVGSGVVLHMMYCHHPAATLDGALPPSWVRAACACVRACVHICMCVHVCTCVCARAGRAQRACVSPAPLAGHILCVIAAPSSKRRTVTLLPLQALDLLPTMDLLALSDMLHGLSGVDAAPPGPALLQGAAERALLLAGSAHTAAAHDPEALVNAMVALARWAGEG